MAAGQDGSDVRRRSVRKRRLWRHRGRAWTSRQRYGRLVSGCPDGAGMRSVPSGPEDFPGRCEKQGMPCAGPRSRAQAGRRAGRVQDWTQALAGPVSLLFLFQGAVSLVRGAFMERPGNSQGAAREQPWRFRSLLSSSFPCASPIRGQLPLSRAPSWTRQPVLHVTTDILRCISFLMQGAWCQAPSQLITLALWTGSCPWSVRLPEHPGLQTEGTLKCAPLSASTGVPVLGSLGILDRTRSSLFAKLMSDRRGRFGRYGQHFLPALAACSGSAFQAGTGRTCLSA